MQTCTMEGVAPSQPGMGVSVSHVHGTQVYKLSVYRNYNDLPNEFGGKGRFKYGDANGKEFASSEEAFGFALDRGYLRPWYPSPEMRARRVARARRP